MVFVTVAKTDGQRKKAAAKDRVKKHREKLHANPELLEEYRRKERERYVSCRKGSLESVCACVCVCVCAR